MRHVEQTLSAVGPGSDGKVIAEPVFGQAKEARRFRRFSLRGLRKVRREWTFVCLCSNTLKLVKAPPVPER